MRKIGTPERIDPVRESDQPSSDPQGISVNAVRQEGPSDFDPTAVVREHEETTS